MKLKLCPINILVMLLHTVMNHNEGENNMISIIYMYVLFILQGRSDGELLMVGVDGGAREVVWRGR